MPGIFRHIQAHSGIFRHIQAYSGIFRHIQVFSFNYNTLNVFVMFGIIVIRWIFKINKF
jgi:hypothetical protein